MIRGQDKNQDQEGFLFEFGVHCVLFGTLYVSHMVNVQNSNIMEQVDFSKDFMKSFVSKWIRTPDLLTHVFWPGLYLPLIDLYLFSPLGSLYSLGPSKSHDNPPYYMHHFAFFANLRFVSIITLFLLCIRLKCLKNIIVRCLLILNVLRDHLRLPGFKCTKIEET